MMTGRLTAVSGFLHGLFSSQSPVRASPKDEEAAMVLDDSEQPQAGPSSSTTLSQDLTVLDDANKENEADLYGVELDMSGAALSGDTGRAITSSGFYGYASQAGGTNKRKRSIFDDKGKGRALDAAPAAPRLRSMNGVFQPVRTYKCPPVDQPLYTLDRVNWTITIHATDADPSYWPSKAHQRSTTAILNTAGPVSSGEAGQDAVLAKKTDWHEPVIQETSQYRSWKQKCGHTLAKLLGLEEPQKWTLAAWPAGYKLFIKHQYAEQYSFFYYIIGSTFLGTRRFKTAKEYSKHLYWLCTFGDDIRAHCKCRFCVRVFEKDGKPRTAIIQRVVKVSSSEGPPPPPSKRRKIAESSVTGDSMQPVINAQDANGLDTAVGAGTPVLSAVGSSLSSKAKAVLEPVLSSGLAAGGSATSSLIPKTAHRAPSTSLGKTASEVFSRLFFGGPPFSAIQPAPSASSQQPTPAAAGQKKGRGRPLGSTAAAIAARKDPMVEVDAASTSMRPSQLEVHKEVTELSASEAVGEHGDGIKLRRTNKKNYYIQSLEEVEAADELAMAAAAEEAAANALLNGSTNGRSVRSTRNQKSMRESTPPPLRGPSGPMYNGPFIHPKRHDELKIHSAPYRVKEVVWYKLPQSHVYPGNERQVITHWPGKVNARTLKIETHHLEIVEMEDLNGDKVQIPQPVNAQYYVYSIELLGVGESTVIECRVEELLPWVAYACPDALRGPQATALLKKTDATLSNLNPSEQVFEEVLTAWAWARHVATAVQTYYCPAGFFLDRETAKKLKRRRKGYASGTKKGKKTRAGKEAREKEYDRELEMLASNVQQYQMVWFGCEKIWVGDMVRLAGTFELPSSVRDGKHGNQHNDKTKKSTGNSKVFPAYIQLYKGRTRQDGKGQFVKLDGYTMTDEHIGNPAFLQVTHIYRVPPDAEQGGAGSPGTLLFDGHIYELAKDDEDPWHASKKPPSLYGDMQGILDASDTSSSSTTATATSKQEQEQGGILNSSNGTRRKKTAQESISNMYKKSLLPPSPPGYSFKSLKRVEGASEEECASGIPVFMIAGRYYDPGVLFGEANDTQTRKLIRACSGKRFRPESTMGPQMWCQNRLVMLQESERSANDAMNKFFNERENKGRLARQHARLREQQKRRREGNGEKGQDEDSEDDDGPMVSTTSRASQHTPSNASANTNRKGKDQKETVNQETTVTIEDDDDSDDVVAVATTRTG